MSIPPDARQLNAGLVDDVAALDPCVQRLCDRAQCIGISVEYRLAPEHRYPAAVGDAYAAVEWKTSPE